MAVFPREFEQYEHAKVTLNKFVDQYEELGEWKLSYGIRSDVMRRARSGLRVRKVAHMKRVHPDLEVTRRQVEAILLCMNGKCPYHRMSFDILETINGMTGGFSSGAIALIAFGPSEKEYEKGKHEQSVKWKLANMEGEHLLKMEKRKYHKLPVWGMLYAEVEKMIAGGITIREPGDDIF